MCVYVIFLSSISPCGERGKVGSYPTMLEPEDLHCPLEAAVVQRREKPRLEKLGKPFQRIFKCSGVSLRLVNISPTDEPSVKYLTYGTCWSHCLITENKSACACVSVPLCTVFWG